LRAFACACARFALRACELDDPVLWQAVNVADRYDALSTVDRDLSILMRAAEAQVDQLDNDAFTAQDREEAGTVPQGTYQRAFQRARAATSALRCLSASAMDAAVEACYEAYFATGNAGAFATMGEAMFNQRD